MPLLTQSMALFVVPKEEPEGDRSYSEGVVRDSFDSIDEFDEYLNKHFFSDLAGKTVPKFDKTAGNDLHLIPGVTELTQETLIDRLSAGDLIWKEQIDYGPAVTLLISDGSKGHGAYLGFDDEDGYFVLYSNIPKREYIDSPLLARLKRVPATSRMHVSSEKLESLAQQTASNNEGTPEPTVWNQTIEERLESQPHCSEIIFKRKRGSDIASPVGAKVQRTMNYYGKDAASVVPFITEKFGMQVSSIRLRYPNTSSKLHFKINREGVLKLKSGSLYNLLEKVDPIIQETLDVKRAYENTETGLFSLGEQKVSKSTPAVISFGAEEGDIGDNSSII